MSFAITYSAPFGQMRLSHTVSIECVCASLFDFHLIRHMLATPLRDSHSLLVETLCNWSPGERERVCNCLCVQRLGFGSLVVFCYYHLHTQMYAQPIRVMYIIRRGIDLNEKWTSAGRSLIWRAPPAVAFLSRGALEHSRMAGVLSLALSVINAKCHPPTGIRHPWTVRVYRDHNRTNI